MGRRDWLARASVAALAATAALLLTLRLQGSLGFCVPVEVARLYIPLFFAFAALHGTVRIGARSTAVFLGLTFAVSLAFEAVGVATGWIYGRYAYTDALGGKLFGVPWVIPLAWFMMMYASYTVARLIVSGGEPADYHRPRTAGRALAHIGLFAGLGALAMTAWDLLVDPINAAMGNYVWLEPGAYFGIPVRNYAGWLATTGTIFVAFRLFEMRWRGREPRDVSDAFRYLPVLAYAGVGANSVLACVQLDCPGAALAGFFAMAPFVAVTATLVFRRRA